MDDTTNIQDEIRLKIIARIREIERIEYALNVRFLLDEYDFLMKLIKHIDEFNAANE
jgi:hypothetical protein